MKLKFSCCLTYFYNGKNLIAAYVVIVYIMQFPYKHTIYISASSRNASKRDYNMNKQLLTYLIMYASFLLPWHSFILYKKYFVSKLHKFYFLHISLCSNFPQKCTTLSWSSFPCPPLVELLFLPKRKFSHTLRFFLTFFPLVQTKTFVDNDDVAPWLTSSEKSLSPVFLAEYIIFSFFLLYSFEQGIL